MAFPHVVCAYWLDRRYITARELPGGRSVEMTKARNRGAQIWKRSVKPVSPSQCRPSEMPVCGLCRGPHEPFLLVTREEFSGIDSAFAFKLMAKYER